MTNPLQGSDEETQERMTGTLNRLRGMVAQCRKNGIKARRFQVDDIAFLLARVDSLESALREAQKDAKGIDTDALVRAIIDCTPTLVNDDWYERFGPLTGELVAAANLEIAIRETWKQDLRKIIADAARADTGEST